MFFIKIQLRSVGDLLLNGCLVAVLSLIISSGLKPEMLNSPLWMPVYLVGLRDFENVFLLLSFRTLCS